MSVKEAAELLGVSRMHVYRLIKRELLHPERNPAYRTRGPVRIPRSEVEALLRR